MADLDADTRVDGGDGRYQAALSADWEIWGPNGGYVAAVALRAAGAHTRHRQPASLLCHFLEVASFGPVVVDVRTVRSSRRADSLAVTVSQEACPILEALVWAIDDGLDGLHHDAAPAPEVPPPAALSSTDERLAARGPGGWFQPAFFANLDERPLSWIEDFERRPAGEPVQRSWYRFRPRAVFGDPWLDAGRLAIVVDTFQWPAAVRGHAGGSLRHIAPSLDLACRFHRIDRAQRAEWLLVEARSPVAAGGLVAGTASVWDDGGVLLASGGQQMLCRPDPRRPAG